MLSGQLGYRSNQAKFNFASPRWPNFTNPPLQEHAPLFRICSGRFSLWERNATVRLRITVEFTGAGSSPKDRVSFRRRELLDGLLRQRPRTRRDRGGSAAPTAHHAGGRPRETHGGDRDLQGGVVRGPGEARFGRERYGGPGPSRHPDASPPRSRYVPYPSPAAMSHPIPPMGVRSGLSGVLGSLVVAEPFGRGGPPTELRGAPADPSDSAHPGTPIPDAPDGPDAPSRCGARWAGLCAGPAGGPAEGAACDGAEPDRDCACPRSGAPRLSTTATKILTTMEWESVDPTLVKICIGREKCCAKCIRKQTLGHSSV